MRIFIFILFLTFAGSIFEGPKKVYVADIQNNIKVGVLTNNKQLSLGVKNVLEEALQDKGFELVEDKWDADYVVNLEINYFDYEQTKSNLSVFHRDENAVVIKMRGLLSEQGKVLKDVSVVDKSTEIVSSTGVIALDGKFSSAMVRNAVKKTCVSVVAKLF